MDPEVWRRITGIFDAALQQPARERASFIERACESDESLRRQVLELLAQFEKAGTFLEGPVFTQLPRLNVGDLIQGRYRIEALLGRGGMGEVYRARDELVRELVALKVLTVATPPGGALLRHFRREVQMARKVTHPSVCRVFEVGLHADGDREVYFYTMELLEGETLAARIRRDGPLPLEDAIHVAQQVAEALHAAHSVNVVHRDFKSANVMLCDGRAVVMDFGLARPFVAEDGRLSSATASIGAHIAGTIAYMSPEQLSGEAVTAASDIYSLGIVLFEMVTGRLPFSDRHILRSAMQRAAAPVPDVRGMAPELNGQWASVIARCLHRDPAQRFPTAIEAVDALRRRRLPTPYWTRRQYMKLAGVSCLFASGVVLIPSALRLYQRTAPLPEGAEVLLGAINNLTNDDRFDAFTELLRNQLAQSARISVIDGSRITEVLSQMAVPDTVRMDPGAIREAAWRLNAALAIYGTIVRVGPDYVLNVQLETRGSQPDRPREKWLRSFSATDPAALMRTAREAAIWVRETVGESAASIAMFDVLPQDATTPSWRALSHYARGQRLFMQQDFNGAIDRFAEALAEDPQFALAALRRADLLISQSRQAEGFTQYKTAMKLLETRSVTRPEELYGRGMFALDSGDLELADRYFRIWWDEYPFDWRPPFYRMVPLCMNGHAAQALDLLRKLQPTLPTYGDLYVQMCRAHLFLGQTNEARRLLPDIRRWNRPERADLHEAYICFREANCVGCLQLLRQVQRSQTYRRAATDAMTHEALLLIDAGYPEAAASNIDAFLRSGSWIDTQPQQIVLRIVQAWAEMLSGHREAAIEHAGEALQSESGPVIIALAGTIFARLGALELAARAQALCAGFDDIRIYRIARHRISGEVARKVGDESRAIAELNAAASLEPVVAHRQYLIEALPPGSAARLELCAAAVRTPWQTIRPPPIHHIGAIGLAVTELNAAGFDEPFAKRFAQSSRALEPLL